MKALEHGPSTRRRSGWKRSLSFRWDFFSAVTAAVSVIALAVGLDMGKTSLAASSAAGATVCGIVRLIFGTSSHPYDPPRIPLSRRWRRS